MNSLDFEKDPSLKAIFNGLDRGVAIFGADKKLIFVNDAMGAITGSREAVGWSLKDLVNRHPLRDESGRVVPAGEFPIEKAFRGEETRGVLFEYCGSDHSRHWLSVSCYCVRDGGKIRYVVTTVGDATRKKGQDDRLHFLIESAKILTLTPDFRKRLVEKAKLAVPSLADWCAIDILNDAGIPERIAVIHTDAKMVDYIYEFDKKYPPDPNAPGSIMTVIATGAPQFIPHITDEMIRAGARSDEHMRDIKKLHLKSLMVLPIWSRGKGLGALSLAFAESGRTYSDEDLKFFQEYCGHISIILDNAHLYEEIRKHDSAKDLFMASLSHELRNPLAPIKSSLELLKLRETQSEIREELDIIEHQFDHMAKLLNDLLDVTRFTQSKIPISPRVVELRRLVERALQASDALLRAADITLHFSYPSNPLEVSVDETRLEQAISNLMSNATKFTPPGGSIWVAVEKDGSTALIRVRDSGAGIDSKDLPHVFEMYYQAKRTKERVNSGLGIGLLLVDKIVSMHGGTIEARSDGPGKGSEFTMRIPLAAASLVQTKDLTGVHIGLARKRILVVDDNQQAADSLTKLLNKLGAHALAVYSAAEALALPGAGAFDVILLDIGMPHMDGYELVKELRARGISITIVALTGYGMQEDKTRALAAGFTTHLTKPVGLKELRDVFVSNA